MHKPYGVYERMIKRPVDFLLALLAFILLSPIMLVVSVLVRIKLGSPIIFKQERPGKIDPKTGQSKIFRLYKFRTMTDAVDKNGNALSDEERMTAFGQKLRSTSLDELPELWNIIRGDMAIVGPRPLLVQYLPLYNDHQMRRHEVRQGLTGLAQVRGRNAISWEQKFDYDVEYVDHITFAGDVKIIMDTVKTVVSHEGINEAGNVTIEPFKGTKE